MTGATVDELRERLEDITAQRRAVERRAVELAAWEVSVRAELDHYAAAEMALRPIGAAAAPRRTRTRATPIPLERTRDAVVALGRFSVSELAVELGCKPSQARRELARPEIARIVEPIEGRERYGSLVQGDPVEHVHGHTRSGAPITDSTIDDLAAEAEAGYEIEAPRSRRGEVVVLRLQTGHAAIKGKIGEDVAVAYTTQSPRELAS